MSQIVTYITAILPVQPCNYITSTLFKCIYRQSLNITFVYVSVEEVGSSDECT